MIPHALLDRRLLAFLAEDLSYEDVTSRLLPEDQRARARVVAKSPGVVAGVTVAARLFELLGVEVCSRLADGEEVQPGTVVLELAGTTRDLLAGERTALNLLMRMSAIATTTRHLVRLVHEACEAATPPVTRVPRVACTRKTTPGFRLFEKEAVRVGGGDLHRWALDDMVLLKDTHLVLMDADVETMLSEARAVTSFSKKIEVEVETVPDALVAARHHADIVMLDNMTPARIRDAVAALQREGLRQGVVLEASGGITGATIGDYATTGVDVISCGFVTLAPTRTVDLSLKIRQLEAAE